MKTYTNSNIDSNVYRNVLNSYHFNLLPVTYPLSSSKAKQGVHWHPGDAKCVKEKSGKGQKQGSWGWGDKIQFMFV